MIKIKEFNFRRFWWLFPLFIFDVCFYYFVQHLVEHNSEGFGVALRAEAVIFLFIISLFSVASVRIVRSQIFRFEITSMAWKYMVIIFLSFLLFAIVIISSQYLLESMLGQVRQFDYYINNLILLSFLHLVVGNSSVAVAYFEEVKDLNETIAQKDRAQSDMELQMLRQQLNPHFLFNNLNSLGSLIAHDPEIAGVFARRLSSIYRYTTRCAREELVSLKDDIKYLEDYFHLLQLKFGDAYSLRMSINNNEIDKWLVVPLSMQTLLENVVKHNAGNKKDPLVVEVGIAKNYLWMKNALQPKLESVEGLGVGLFNLNKQYQVIAKAPIQVEQATEYFMVRLPLILKAKS